MLILRSFLIVFCLFLGFSSFSLSPLIRQGMSPDEIEILKGSRPDITQTKEAEEIQIINMDAVTQKVDPDTIQSVGKKKIINIKDFSKKIKPSIANQNKKEKKNKVIDVTNFSREVESDIAQSKKSKKMEYFIERLNINSSKEIVPSSILDIYTKQGENLGLPISLDLNPVAAFDFYDQKLTFVSVSFDEVFYKENQFAKDFKMSLNKILDHLKKQYGEYNENFSDSHYKIYSWSVLQNLSSSGLKMEELTDRGLESVELVVDSSRFSINYSFKGESCYQVFKTKQTLVKVK